MGKIGSEATYHRRLKILHDWKYIVYLPSFNPYKGSQVKLLKFRTGIETGSIQTKVPYTNTIKQKTNNNKQARTPEINKIIEFFKKEKCRVTEGERFYNYYDGVSWKIRGQNEITNWKTKAKNWILRLKEGPPERIIKLRKKII